MEWLILVAICLYGGWWLLTIVLGGGETAVQEMKAAPARGCMGIVFFAVVFLVGLTVIGLATKGCEGWN